MAGLKHRRFGLIILKILFPYQSIIESVSWKKSAQNIPGSDNIQSQSNRSGAISTHPSVSGAPRKPPGGLLTRAMCHWLFAKTSSAACNPFISQPHISVPNANRSDAITYIQRQLNRILAVPSFQEMIDASEAKCPFMSKNGYSLLHRLLYLLADIFERRVIEVSLYAASTNTRAIFFFCGLYPIASPGHSSNMVKIGDIFSSSSR
jgi:hypothetical protein